VKKLRLKKEEEEISRYYKSTIDFTFLTIRTRFNCFNSLVSSTCLY